MLVRLMSIVAFSILVLPFLSSEAKSEPIADLRDEGICNIGWIAGNARGHAIWPELRPYVGEGGEYYDGLVRLRAPGETDEVAAYGNVALYDRCSDQGASYPYNEQESMDRVVRLLQIIDELTIEMQSLEPY